MPLVHFVEYFRETSKETPPRRWYPYRNLEDGDDDDGYVRDPGHGEDNGDHLDHLDNTLIPPTDSLYLPGYCWMLSNILYRMKLCITEQLDAEH